MSDQFISHPNTRTLHRGTRESGAECGQPSGNWAEIDAETPLGAVYTYGTSPCSKCFRHAAGLQRVVLKEHSAYRIGAELSEIVDRLPWPLNSGEIDD